jgi:hypothetical protein
MASPRKPKKDKDEKKVNQNKANKSTRPDGTPRPKGHKKHVMRTPVAKRRTSGTQSRGEVRKNVTARLKADKPALKGKALKTRINKQTAGAVKRKTERGMKITSKPKSKKKDK